MVNVLAYGLNGPGLRPGQRTLCCVQNIMMRQSEQSSQFTLALYETPACINFPSSSSKIT